MSCNDFEWIAQICKNSCVKCQTLLLHLTYADEFCGLNGQEVVIPNLTGSRDICHDWTNHMECNRLSIYLLRFCSFLF